MKKILLLSLLISQLSLADIKPIESVREVKKSNKQSLMLDVKAVDSMIIGVQPFLSNKTFYFQIKDITCIAQDSKGVLKIYTTTKMSHGESDYLTIDDMKQVEYIMSILQYRQDIINTILKE